jgi:outer membrane biogenesis lipoprotein LolB
MRFLLTMSLSALLGACAVDAPLQPGVDETVAIQEAVFRYQFQHNASSRKQAADFYCLGILENKNPRPELMERFAGHAPAVVPVS